MCKKQAVFAGLLVFMTASLLVTGCIGFAGVRVGDLQTRSQTVALGDADAVDVEIQMSAGELDVSGGADELLEASFSYNVEEMDPQATYSGRTLRVKDSDVNEGIASLFDLDEFRNEWDLKLNEDVPMQMTIDLGAGPSSLVLGTLHLTSLDVNGGAGEITIDLTGDWQDDLDANISGGVGNLNVWLPENVGVRIEVESGVGSVHADGLTRDGDTYTNDAYGVSDATLRIDIEGGVGQINLVVEQ